MKPMAFVSRNPKNSLNPEVAENFVSMEAKNTPIGTEVIGFFKHVYTDSLYKNKCYVIKGKEDGLDYLFYGCASLHNEMAYYSIGDLVSIVYKGTKENKSGPFAGKSSNIWKVNGENSWMPSPDFVQSLQQEVMQRKAQVNMLLANTNQYAQQQSYNPQPQQFNQQWNQQPQQQYQQQYQQPQQFTPSVSVAPVSAPKKNPFG